MNCPKCKGRLETKKHEGVRIERCDTCYGILVEDYMLDEMKVSFMSETFLDVGKADIGRKYDKIVDPDQTHIWLESCPQCMRVWLDAGEFTDLKYETFGDKFKALLKGKRKITA